MSLNLWYAFFDLSDKSSLARKRPNCSFLTSLGKLQIKTNGVGVRESVLLEWAPPVVNILLFNGIIIYKKC